MDVTSSASELVRYSTATDEKKEWLLPPVRWTHKGVLVHECLDVVVVLIRTIYGPKAKCSAYLTFRTQPHGYGTKLGGYWPEPSIAFFHQTPRGGSEIHRVKFDRTPLQCRPQNYSFSSSVPDELFTLIDDVEIPELVATFEKC